jgi:Inner membrane component of T3SS, cytoplasmic domain
MQPALTVFVRRGIHRGARLELKPGRYTLGRGDDCDVVLTDPGIAERHLVIAIEDRDVQVETLAENTKINGDLVAIGVVTRLCHTKTRVNICDVDVYLLDAQQIIEPPVFTKPRTIFSGLREHGRRVPLLVFAVLCSFIGLAGFSALSGAPQLVHNTATTDNREPLSVGVSGISLESVMRLGTLLSRTEALRHVKLRKNETGNHELVGTVTDHRALKSLLNVPEVKQLGLSTKNVLVAEELNKHISNFSRNATVSTKLSHDGRLIVSGSVANGDEANRMLLLRKELHGKLSIDYQIEPRAALSKSVQMPLPFKVTSVNVAQRFFETSTGETYFEGSTTTGGIKVVSVEMNRILFAVAGKNVEFKM